MELQEIITGNMFIIIFFVIMIIIIVYFSGDNTKTRENFWYVYPPYDELCYWYPEDCLYWWYPYPSNDYHYYYLNQYGTTDKSHDHDRPLYTKTGNDAQHRRSYKPNSSAMRYNKGMHSGNTGGMHSSNTGGMHSGNTRGSNYGGGI